MIKIRAAKETDVDIIALLGRITYAESHGHFIENNADLLQYLKEAFSISKIRNELKDPNSLFYIVLVDDFPVGYGKLALNAHHKNIKSKKICRLERIYILNDFIPLKIGQQLFDVLVKKATELKFEAMWLTVYIKNYRGINFYNKNGFKNVGSYNFMVNGVVYENELLAKEL